jgi:hypothetical protein
MLCLSAQTPAPPPVTVTPLAKTRHLQYSFNVSYSRGLSVANVAGSLAALGHSPYLVSTGGRDGHVDVDIVGLTSDGGVVAKIYETAESAPHPGEVFTCLVYGDGRTACPGAGGPLSDTENVLLSFLGRDFFDPAKLDAHNHWQHKYNGKEVTVTTDYTVRDGDHAPLVVIVEHSTVTSTAMTMGDTILDAKVIYDSAMLVPDNVHSVADERSRGRGWTTMDLLLVQDSFAHQ